MHPDLWRAEAILRRYGIVWPIRARDDGHADILVCDGIGVHFGSPDRDQRGADQAATRAVCDRPNELVHSAPARATVEGARLLRYGNSGASDEN